MAATETAPTDYPTAAYIVDLDPCDASNDLCEKWAVADMTVKEFDQAMREFAADKELTNGGYAKLRGKFLFQVDGEEKEIEFRIDVDRNMSEGRTLHARMARVASWYRSDKGREFEAGFGRNAGDSAELYEQASKAAAHCYA